ncbi:MAG: dephospho-CoA kinase [Termitinemataceae bacterium]|nr:MAG: dephospho-CoA kinase [Termitinemataceae bacterium]
MKLYGITGFYCAGKNYVASLFALKGFAVLDVDKLGHLATENKKSEIIECFGKDILNESGSIDRRKLGSMVFGKSNTDKLTRLEGIIHPEANRLTEEWLLENKDKDCLVNAALLHKSSVFSRLTCVIIVRSPLWERLLRARKRDHLSWVEIIHRFSTQKFNLKKIYKFADIVCIYNKSAFKSRKYLEKQVDVFLWKRKSY